MQEQPKKRGRGKPRIELDMEEVKKWARSGATIVEMAQRLGVAHSTLDNRMAEPEFRAEVEKAQSELKISLRSKQVAMALAGNVTMLIWLGKQFLGQKDKQEISGAGPGGRIEIGASTAAQRIAARIDGIAAQIEEGSDTEGNE